MITKPSVSVTIVQNRPQMNDAGEPIEDDRLDKKDDSEEARYLNSLYTFAILAAFCLNAAVLFLIPRNNSIFYPEFWYETILYVIVGNLSRAAASHILELFIFTKVQILLKPSHYLKVFLTCTLSFAIPYCISYLVWTKWLNNNHPLPHLGAFLLFGDISINMIAFWFFLSNELREQETIKRQAKTFLLFRIWEFVQNFTRGALTVIAKTSQQWLLILLIPMVRNLSIWVAERLVKRYPETNHEDVKFLVRSHLMINYTSYLASQISTMTRGTVYGILMMELFLHGVSCYQIIKMNSRINEEDQQASNETIIGDQKLKAQTLVLSEFTEAIVPIFFAIVFTMAFVGPNSGLIKGVGNNFFGEQPIVDVEPFYFGMIQMFAFDVVAVIMGGISLKYLCHINLFQEFCNVMKQYWMIFLIKLPSIIIYYFLKDVNLGMDGTFEFLWTSEKGRQQLICNAVELSDEEKAALHGNCTFWG